jgi:hypothetical protein
MYYNLLILYIKYFVFLLFHAYIGNRRDRMVVGFTTTYAISAYRLFLFVYGV